MTKYPTIDPIEDVAELVLDGGMLIVILCNYGDRRYPAHAYLMVWNVQGYQDDLAQIPIPAFCRNDIPLPHNGPPLDFGREGYSAFND